MSEKMEHSNTTVSSGKFGQIWVFTFYTHLHTYIPFVKVGTGFCPQTAFGREPVDRRLAKCDAGSSRTGGFSPPRRGFSALDWRIAPVFSCVARTSAQRGLFLPRRTHTRCRDRKPHTAATRASRHGAGARHTRRVDRADCFHGWKIGTIGTFEGNPPFAVAAVGIRQNPFFS